MRGILLLKGSLTRTCFGDQLFLKLKKFDCVFYFKRLYKNHLFWLNFRLFLYHQYAVYCP